MNVNGTNGITGEIQDTITVDVDGIRDLGTAEKRLGTIYTTNLVGSITDPDIEVDNIRFPATGTAEIRIHKPGFKTLQFDDNLSGPIQSTFIGNLTAGTVTSTVMNDPTNNITANRLADATHAWNLPLGATAPILNQVLGYDGTQLSWMDNTTSGTVIGPASSATNAISRFADTTGTLIKNSGILVDDSNNVSGVADISSTTGVIRNTTLNGSIILSPNGVGNFQASEGGDPRGAYAVDLQLRRSVSSNVAGANSSGILGGFNNSITSAGLYSVIGGGFSNSISAQDAVICGGSGNQVLNGASCILGGGANTVGIGGYGCSILGGSNASVNHRCILMYNAGDTSNTAESGANYQVIFNLAPTNYTAPAVSGFYFNGFDATFSNAVISSSLSTGAITATSVSTPSITSSGSNISLNGKNLTNGGTFNGVNVTNLVAGPVSSTDNSVCRFDLTTGKLIQNSGVIIDDSNNISGVGTINGIDISTLGTGDVHGPVSSADNAVCRFDLTTGKLIQNSGVIIDDSNNISGVGTINGINIGSLGTGDVVGPASSTDNAIVRFDSTTGKLIQNSTVILDDAGKMSSLATLNSDNSITNSGTRTLVAAATYSTETAQINSASVTDSLVACGLDNRIISSSPAVNRCMVLGGQLNYINGSTCEISDSTILNSQSSYILGNGTGSIRRVLVAGGNGNQVSTSTSGVITDTVVLGSNNSVGTVTSGTLNYCHLMGTNITMTGGTKNVAIGNNITYSGALSNSFAIGNYLGPNTNGCLLLGDNSTTSLLTSGINSLSARYAGGYYLFTNALMTVGIQALPNATSFSSISDTRLKKDMINVDTSDIYDKLKKIDVFNYKFKNDDSEQIRIGVSANKIHDEFAGTYLHEKKNKDGYYLVNGDEIAYLTLAATKELQKIVERQQKEITELKSLVKQMLIKQDEMSKNMRIDEIIFEG